MIAKLIVLYPRPLDPDAFERQYHGKHIPLMRRLLGSTGDTATYRVTNSLQAQAPFYRLSEITFADRETMLAYLRSDATSEGRESAEQVSTGGKPTFLLCIADDDPSSEHKPTVTP